MPNKEREDYSGYAQVVIEYLTSDLLRPLVRRVQIPANTVTGGDA